MPAVCDVENAAPAAAMTFVVAPYGFSTGLLKENCQHPSTRPGTRWHSHHRAADIKYDQMLELSIASSADPAPCQHRHLIGVKPFRCAAYHRDRIDEDLILFEPIPSLHPSCTVAEWSYCAVLDDRIDYQPPFDRLCLATCSERLINSCLFRGEHRNKR